VSTVLAALCTLPTQPECLACAAPWLIRMPPPPRCLIALGGLRVGEDRRRTVVSAETATLAGLSSCDSMPPALADMLGRIDSPVHAVSSSSMSMSSWSTPRAGKSSLRPPRHIEWSSR
jgi:hypothetical protein